MKKKMIFLMLFSAMLFSLVACGKKEESKKETEQEVGKEETAVVEDYNVDDYVTKLGNYIGVEFEKQETETTEEEVKMELDAFLNAHPVEVKDRAVQNGDIANIDFVGKKDGVAFDGGTAKGYNLTIGSGSFIPGFEEGLVGKKIGETVDLDLQFPETYHSEELKGAKVVFTVTINSISTPAKELTDEFVAKNSTEVKTVEELKNKVKKEINERKEQSAKNMVQTELLKKVIEDSEIKEIPKSLKGQYVNNYVSYYENKAKENGLELEDYLKKVWNMTVDEMNKNADNIAENLGKQKLIIDAIVKKENITVSEEEYKKELEEYYKASGFEGQMDIKTFEKTVGTENVNNIVKAKKVFELLQKNGVAK